ncbi:receptor-like protein kinase [Musa troglodytarum]|uniref:Receptor-like protein kinase n=1 Tax=Musa troglodytarum TaxID=320322 RepID=A0A9E7HFT9_9LILI|nr:receptor-like protein kinase [Musa troglodytarum]
MWMRHRGTLAELPEHSMQNLQFSSLSFINCKLDISSHPMLVPFVDGSGYMAPEYVLRGRFSTNSDVYSYGVLILEILTGRKNSGYQGSGNSIDLLGYVWRHWNLGDAMQVVDQSVIDQCQPQEVLRCMHIGLLCVQEDPAQRPSMASITLMLNSYSVGLPTPSAPAFVTRSITVSGSAGTLNADQPRDLQLPLKQRFYLQPLPPSEAAARAKESAKDILNVKQLIDKKEWPYVMNDLRLRAGYLRFDLSTIISAKPKEEKKALEELTGKLFAAIDELDHAAKIKSTPPAEKYYATTKSRLDDWIPKVAGLCSVSNSDNSDV